MPAATASSRLRFLGFLLFVAATAAVAWFRIGDSVPLTPDALRASVRSWGRLAPLMFAGAFVIRPFIFFPSTLLFVAGGLAFGTAWGTVYSAAGATIGALVGFAIARGLGHDFVEQQLRRGVRRFDDRAWGAGLVFFLNLVPIVPMTAINYGAGLSRIRVLPFMAAVAAGLTPRAFAYSFFGHSLLDLGSRQFIAAIAVLVTLIVVPFSARRYMSARAEPAVLPPLPD